MRDNLPKIELRAHAGVQFRLPDRALAQWDNTITAAKSEDAVISILAPIYEGNAEDGVFSAAQIIAAIAAANKKPLTLNINSPGGSYFEGVTIFNLLRDYPNRITVNVLGEAASAASVVAMAGDRIRMHPGALMMIHSASGLAIGNKQDMRELATVLDKIDNTVADLYAARTGKSRDKILEMMEAETWMTPEECVTNGFADEVVKDQKPSKSAKATATAPAAIGNQRATVLMQAKTSPGATGLSANLKGAIMQTTNERIQALENTRAATVARMEALEAAAAGEGRTFNEQELEEFGGLDADVQATDAQLVAARRMAELKRSTAQPVIMQAATDGAVAAQVRQPAGSGIRVVSNVDKGVRFARAAIAIYLGQGHPDRAAAIAQANKRWMFETPDVHQYLMTAVEAGTKTASGWADDFVYPTNLVSEFVDLLRAQTILDRIPGLRRVPFNIRMGTQTSGTTAYWVGEARPIPMSKLATANLSLDRHKVAALCALSEELARDGSPGAEAFIRDDMLKEARELIDTSLIDPDRAEVSGISPASLTYGVSPVTPTGTTAAALRTDLMTLMNKYSAANLSPAGGVFVMTQTTANALMWMTNALGQREFPEFNMAGGMASLGGYPVIISQTALAASSPVGGNLIIFLVPSEILLADDGEADVSFSKEASLEMSDAPANTAGTGTGASLVSMYQNDSTAIRVRRFITWKKRQSTAVQFIQDAEYTA